MTCLQYIQSVSIQCTMYITCYTVNLAVNISIIQNYHCMRWKISCIFFIKVKSIEFQMIYVFSFIDEGKFITKALRYVFSFV